MRRYQQAPPPCDTQGFLGRRTFASDDQGHTLDLLALTQRGREVLEAQRSRAEDEGRSEQAVHAGWRKPAELIRDASLYWMYQVEAAAIEDRGGRIERVVLWPGRRDAPGGARSVSEDGRSVNLARPDPANPAYRHRRVLAGVYCQSGRCLEAPHDKSRQ